MRRTKQITCILLILVLLLTGSFHEELPVLAADTTESMYKWHRVMTMDDLRKYVDAEGNVTDYEGVWVPIIIVAEYADGTQYYINRNTRQAIRDGEAEYIPVMNEVSSHDSVGAVLRYGIASGKDFVTRGDLGAMHMYYHGMQKARYVNCDVVDNVESEAWSLTDWPVADFSADVPGRVYGLQFHRSAWGWYAALDQNNVETWNGTNSLPKTYSPLDTDDSFNQAWTFFEDRKPGYFLISNLFSLPNGEDGYPDFDAPTWGCALDGNSRYNSPNEKKRNMIETPSRAAALMDGKPFYNQENMKDDILKRYESKYNKENTRVWFKIYVGEEIPGGTVMSTMTIKNQTMTIGTGNMIPKDATITVEQGATLVIPEDCWLYLDGKIINKGTVIVEKNVVISSSDSNRCGSITCEDGGLLLVMEGAQVMLGNGLTLQRNGQVINRGLITVRDVFSINDSQIQIAAGGRLAIGFVYSNPDVLYVSDYKGTYDDFNKYVFRQSRPYYYVIPSDNYTVTGSSKIIVEKGGALDLCYTINPYSFNESSLVIGMDNGVENGLYGVETRSPYAQQQAHTYTGRLGTYYEFSYEACY